MNGVDGANSTINVNHWKRHRSQSGSSLVRVKSQATLSPSPVRQAVGLTVPPCSTSPPGLSDFFNNVPSPKDDVTREEFISGFARSLSCNESQASTLLSGTSQRPTRTRIHPKCLIFPDGTRSDIPQTPELQLSHGSVDVHHLYQGRYISSRLLWLKSDGFSSPATVAPDMRLLVFRNGCWVPVGDVDYTNKQDDEVLRATYMHTLSRPLLFTVSPTETGLQLHPVSGPRNNPSASHPNVPGRTARGKQTVTTPSCVVRSGILNTEAPVVSVSKHGTGFVVMSPQCQKRYLTQLNIFQSNFTILQSGTGLNVRCHDSHEDLPVIGVQVADDGMKCSLLLRLQTDGVLAAFDSSTMTWAPLGGWTHGPKGVECHVRIEGDSSSSLEFTISNSSDDVQVDFTTIDLRYNQKGVFGPLPQFSTLSHRGLYDWGFHEFVNIDRMVLGQCAGFHDPLVGKRGNVSVRKLHMDPALSAQAPFDVLRTCVVVDSTESNMNMFFITTDDHEVYQVFPLADSETSETTWLVAQGQVLLEIVRQPSGGPSLAYFDDIDLTETQTVRAATPDYHNDHFPGLTMITSQFKLKCDHSGFWSVHDKSTS